MKFVIFVEGLTDEKFFKDIIPFFFPELKYDEDYKIQVLNGKDKLITQIETLERYIFSGTSIAICLDADKDITSTNDNIKKQIGSNLLSKCKIFLLPNDQTAGNLESLLLNLTHPEHTSVFSCFDEYAKCIEAIGNYKSLTDKAKILAYIEVIITKNKIVSLSDDRFSFQDKVLWNLDSEALVPLKNFIVNLIGDKSE